MRVYPPVHLQLDVQAGPVDELPGPGDLGHHLGHEALPAEAGVHGHHQHHIDAVQPRLAGFETRLRVDCQPGPQPELTHLRDQLSCTADLDVHGAAVGSCVAERLQVLGGVVHHQVAVEVEVAVAPDPLQHHRADREVGHKVPVHHVDMEHVGFGPDAVYLVGQTGEVSREYRRRDAHPARHPARASPGRVLCHGRRT